MSTTSCSTPCSACILGGRIGYVLFYGMAVLGQRPAGIRSRSWEGGMSFHGGLIGGSSRS